MTFNRFSKKKINLIINDFLMKKIVIKTINDFQITVTIIIFM